MSHSNRKSIFEILGRGPVHPFPARMAPGIALDVVSGGNTHLRVLDPMMGSGTVLAVARSKGHRAYGVDMDPLAVLISQVWTTSIDKERVQAKAAEVLERARGEFKEMSVRDAYPKSANQETRKFVAYWFDSYARLQLAALSASISRVRHETTRNALWCAFSRLIIAKQGGASLAMDLSHSRPHKSFERAPSKPFNRFVDAVKHVTENAIGSDSPNRGPATSLREGDARNLPLDDGSIDLVLTSPPYLNAIDYMRCSKFSLVWMGYPVSEIRRLRGESVGSEIGLALGRDERDIRHIVTDLRLHPRLSNRHEGMLVRYIRDMQQALSEVARVLVPGGKAVYVIGENTIKGTFIRNSIVVNAVAEMAGLHLDNRRVRTLPANRRYLPPPSALSDAAIETRLHREVVMSFSKPIA